MKNNTKKWIWKKQVDKNRFKAWEDGTVEYGTATSWLLYPPFGEEAVAMIWKEQWHKEWRCNRIELDSTHFFHEFLTENLEQGKRRLEKSFEDFVLSEVVNKVKPRLSSSNQKRL